MAAGIHVNGALERFMGNETLLEQMLNKFKDDTYFQKLLEAAKQLNGGIFCNATKCYLFDRRTRERWEVCLKHKNGLPSPFSAHQSFMT